SPTTTYHDFLGGPVDNTDSIVVGPGGRLACVLQWADPFGASANDYDLYLLDASMREIASGRNFQTGSQDPVEVAGVYNPSPYPQKGNVVIDRYAAAARRLATFCRGGSRPGYPPPPGRILGPPPLAEVVTRRAIRPA